MGSGKFMVASKKRYSAKGLQWLLPGLLLKRWLVMLLLGLGFTLLGFALLLNLQPITWVIEVLKEMANLIPSWLSGSLLLAAGLGALFYGLNRVNNTLQTVSGSDERWLDELLEKLYRQNKLDRGPRIVAIGGGTGLSTLLRGLKRHTNNITAVVTVGDDGGSSGRLRSEQGIIPPGDIRNCIAALADEEQLITELFQYRFTLGQGLEGHSFGNLFLTAMCRITGDMMKAIKESSKVLNIRGRVLPSTLENVSLVAEMADGEIIKGESQIPESGKPIKRLFCEPECPQPLPEVVEALRHADLILYGPGSLYTSVLPNLLLQPIVDAIKESKAPRVYIANMVSQPGETDGYTVGDHVQVLIDHTGMRDLISAVVVNKELPEPLVEKYKAAGSLPVHLDVERLAGLGVEVICESLVDSKSQKLRHSPKKLGLALAQWYQGKKKKAVGVS